MKTVFFPLLLCICCISTSKSQTIQNFVFQFSGMNEDQASSDSLQKVRISAFWKNIKLLHSSEIDEKKINGSSTFGMNADQSENRDYFQIDGSLHVSRGTYPSQFTFSSEVGIVLNNKVFNEDLSNIHISYDFHPSIGNGLLFENYVFMNRFTDQFLGVDQRYEIGIGSTIAYWSSKLTSKGESKMKELDNIPNENNLKNPDSSQWVLATKDYCAKSGVDPLSKEDLRLLNKMRTRTVLAIRKMNSKVRAGMLMGVFAEMEKISYSDSVHTNSGGYIFSNSFEPTRKLRWEIRPTLDLRPNSRLLFKFRPYIKFPMPWEWTQKVQKGSQISDKIDYRVDFESSLSIKLSDDLLFPDYAIRFVYRIYYDNAPQRTFLEAVDVNQNYVLFSAANYHQYYSMEFTIDF